MRKDAVHEAVEGGGGIREAEGHLEELKAPKWGGGGGRLNGFLGQRHLGIAGGEGEGRDEAALCQIKEEVLDAWVRESIFLGLLIEPSIVDAQPELTSVEWGGLIGDYDNGEGVGALDGRITPGIRTPSISVLNQSIAFKGMGRNLILMGGQAFGIDLVQKEEGLSQIGIVMGEGL